MTANAAEQPTVSQAVPSLQVGYKAPLLNAAFSGGSGNAQNDVQGKHIVLYFYPRDDTPGCTMEAKNFKEHSEEFANAGAVIIGVSRDSLKSHQKFQEKYCLPFILASDEDGSTCEAYGVWVEKSMYGKAYMGIERTTFVIDKNGVIRNIWHKVKVDSHVKEVLSAVQAL